MDNQYFTIYNQLLLLIQLNTKLDCLSVQAFYDISYYQVYIISNIYKSASITPLVLFAFRSEDLVNQILPLAMALTMLKFMLIQF